MALAQVQNNDSGVIARGKINTAISNVDTLNTSLAAKADTTYVDSENALDEKLTSKDATGGYVGLTLFNINFKNVANTITSFFTNSNTAPRTYTFPDKGGTVAMLSDIAGASQGAGESLYLYNNFT